MTEPRAQKQSAPNLSCTSILFKGNTQCAMALTRSQNSNQDNFKTQLKRKENLDANNPILEANLFMFPKLSAPCCRWQPCAVLPIAASSCSICCQICSWLVLQALTSAQKVNIRCVPLAREECLCAPHMQGSRLINASDMPSSVDANIGWQAPDWLLTRFVLHHTVLLTSERLCSSSQSSHQTWTRKNKCAPFVKNSSFEGSEGTSRAVKASADLFLSVTRTVTGFCMHKQHEMQHDSIMTHNRQVSDWTLAHRVRTVVHRGALCIRVHFVFRDET